MVVVLMYGFVSDFIGGFLECNFLYGFNQIFENIQITTMKLIHVSHTSCKIQCTREID